MPPSVPISAVSVIIRDFTLLRCLRRQKNHPPIAKARISTPAIAIPAIAGPPRCLLLVALSAVEGPLPSGERNVDALLLLPELKASESVMELESLSEPIDETLNTKSDGVTPGADVFGGSTLLPGVLEAVEAATAPEALAGGAVEMMEPVVVAAVSGPVGVGTVTTTAVEARTVPVPVATDMTVVPPSCRFIHDTQSENMC